jgi:hypothetical protein
VDETEGTTHRLLGESFILETPIDSVIGGSVSYLRPLKWHGEDREISQ